MAFASADSRLESAASPLCSGRSCSSTRSSSSGGSSEEGSGTCPSIARLSRQAPEPTDLPAPTPRISETCSSSDGGAGCADENSVRVALRSRPLISRELLEGARVCVAVDEAARCVTLGRDRRFTFDHAFGAQSTQEQVYSECVAPLVEGCFEGYNATVLAYGQTGSGKTYSMGTGDVVHVSEQQLGITPRVIRHLFDGIARRQAGRSGSCQVRAQFLEIHNEELKDLLHPDIPSKSMAIRESPDGEILVVGAGERPADSAEELLLLLETGFRARSTGATQMNEQSSRSHAIFTIMLEQHRAPDGQGGHGEFRSAKLHLVDLAGSERTKKSGVLGARFKETVTINQGLLCLGNVISALGDERKRGGHVPYRASKLTRLLQGSLGGNSRTLMLATVSSADDSLEETLNTLKYANRARNIRNSPTPNRGNDAADAAGTQLAARQLAVHELRSVVLRRLLDAPRPGGGGSPAADAQAQQLRELLLADLSTPHACAEATRQLRCALAEGGADGGTLPPWCVLPGELQLGGQVLLQRPSAVAAQQQAGRLQGQLAAARAEAAAAAANAEAVYKAQLHAEQQLQGSLRAINGMMRALAEAEARRQVPPAVRDRIMQAIDAATEGIAAHGSGGSQLDSSQASSLMSAASGRSSQSLPPPPAAMRASVQSHPLHLLGLGDSQTEEALAGLLAGRERDEAHHALEDKVRSLEAALAAHEVELAAARDDLQRDEVIFADKMRELSEARRVAEEAEARGQDMEARFKHEVAALHEELQRHRAALLTTRRVSSPHGATSPRKQQYSGTDPRHRLCRPRSAGAADGGGTPSRLASPSGSTGRPGDSPDHKLGGSGAGRPFIFRISEEGRASAADEGGWEDGGVQRDASGAPYRPGGQYDQEWGCGQDAVVLYDDELLSYISETDYTDQQAGAFFDGEVHHAEELNRVLQQRAAAEEERARLEAAAVEQQAAFDEQRDALEGQLAALATEITAQESMMCELRRSEQEAREQGRAYQERMRQLEDQLASKSSEVNQLRQELRCVEEDVARTEEQRATSRQQYEERIAAVMEEMSALRLQLKDQDRQRLDRERLKALSRAQQLETDLSRLHSQQADLQRQVLEREQRHEREAAQRQRETGNLRRAAELARKRLAELEAENREQRVQLRQKAAEVAQAQRRLKVLIHPRAERVNVNSSSHSSLDSVGRTTPRAAAAAGPARPLRSNDAGGTGGGWTPAGRSMTSHSRLTPNRLPRRNAASSVPGGPVTQQLAGQYGGGRDVSPLPQSASRRDKAGAACRQEQGYDEADGGRDVSPMPSRRDRTAMTAAGAAAAVQDPKLWLEPQVKLLAGRAGWERKLQALAGRAEALQCERAALMDARSQRQLKLLRRSAELRTRASALGGQLVGLMVELAQAELDADEDYVMASGPASASRSQADCSELQQQVATVSHERDAPEQRLRSRQLTSAQEQQVSDALDDRLDAMEAEIEFVSGEAAAARAALGRIDEARAQLLRQATALPAADARRAVQHLVELMAKAGVADAESPDQNDRTAQLEAALRAAATQLSELQDSVRAREAEMERRLAAAQHAQAQRMQGVLSRLAPLMAVGGDEVANLAASLAGLVQPASSGGGGGGLLAASSSGCPTSMRESSAVQASMCSSSIRSSVGLGSSDLRQLIMMYRDRSTSGSTSSHHGPTAAGRSSAGSSVPPPTPAPTDAGERVPVAQSSDGSPAAGCFVGQAAANYQHGGTQQAVASSSAKGDARPCSIMEDPVGPTCAVHDSAHDSRSMSSDTVRMTGSIDSSICHDQPSLAREQHAMPPHAPEAAASARLSLPASDAAAHASQRLSSGGTLRPGGGSSGAVWPLDFPDDPLFDDCYGSAGRPGPLAVGGAQLLLAGAASRQRGTRSSGGAPPPPPLPFGRSSVTSELLQKLKASARAKGLLVGHRD